MTLDSEQRGVLNNLLLEAVKNGDAAHVRLYVEKGADVNARFTYNDQWGYSRTNPLYHFIPGGDFSTEISDYLISKGVDVDIKDYNGNTRLMLAAKDLDLPLTKYLLSKGADPLSKNSNGDIVLEQVRLKPTNYSARQSVIDALVEAIDAPVGKDLPSGEAPAGEENARTASSVETTHEVQTLKTIELVPRKKNGGGLNL